MSRMSIVALSSKTPDDPYLRELESLSIELGFSFRSVCGTFADILQDVNEWKILPEVLIFECPVGMEIQEALRAFGDVAPEGETETLLFNVPNDIASYRALKAMGIVEVFSGDPDMEEVRPSLEFIASKELRNVGIDPRRVVYVWSASGGAGGTTFALAFASNFAREGRRTLLIDMDIFAAPVSFMFNASNGAHETTGLLDILASPGRVDALFLERAIQKARENLYYLSSRRRASDNKFDIQALPMIIARAQQNFDMIVVDTPWRALPEPDWVRVNGPSYIVANPNPQGLLGFSTIVKELQNSATKATVTGILNKLGEFKSNDIQSKVFTEGFSGKLLSFPYDPAEAGRLFFEQKSLDQMRGKARRPLSSILATLPARAMMKEKGSFGPSSSGAPIGVASTSRRVEKKAGFLSKLLKK